MLLLLLLLCFKSRSPIVDLERVTNIMQGQTTPQFQRWVSVFDDAKEKSFSIVYLSKDNEERTLDVITPSPEVFHLCYDGLSALIKKLREQRENFSLDALYLKSLWDRADHDHSGSLTSKEVIHLVQSINVNMPVSKIKSMYKSFDTDNNGEFDFQEFIEFMTYLRKRYEHRLYSLIIFAEFIFNIKYVDPTLKQFGMQLFQEDRS